jgi:hypothetical protein
MRRARSAAARGPGQVTRDPDPSGSDGSGSLSRRSTGTPIGIRNWMPVTPKTSPYSMPKHMDQASEHSSLWGTQLRHLRHLGKSQARTHPTSYFVFHTSTPSHHQQTASATPEMREHRTLALPQSLLPRLPSRGHVMALPQAAPSAVRLARRSAARSVGPSALVSKFQMP